MNDVTRRQAIKAAATVGVALGAGSALAQGQDKGQGKGQGQQYTEGREITAESFAQLPWDCVTNETDKFLMVTISSGRGSLYPVVLAPKGQNGSTVWFNFHPTTKLMALAAFEYHTNNPVLVTTFDTLDQTPLPQMNCVLISEGAKTIQRRVGQHGTHEKKEIKPTNPPF